LPQIEQQLADPGLADMMRTILETSRSALQQQLDKASGPVSISWYDMAGQMATSSQQLRDWIAAHYRDLDSIDFNAEQGVRNLANLLLAREFLRRPKRQNSLESMGLVQVFYPSLEAKVTRVPKMAEELGFTRAQWLDFLKLLLDWHVRASQAVVHETYWSRWIGNRFPFKHPVPAAQQLGRGGAL
jgi:hypothetical protein